MFNSYIFPKGVDILRFFDRKKQYVHIFYAEKVQKFEEEKLFINLVIFRGVMKDPKIGS